MKNLCFAPANSVTRLICWPEASLIFSFAITGGIGIAFFTRAPPRSVFAGNLKTASVLILMRPRRPGAMKESPDGPDARDVAHIYSALHEIGRCRVSSVA